MDFTELASIIYLAKEMGNILIFLPDVIEKIQRIKIKGGFELKTNNEKIDNLKEYINSKKSKEERKRCKAILKKHNLPKSVGIMCKSENDICFIPNKAIVNKNLNNLSLKSNDGTVKLFIGGGSFAFSNQTNNAGFIHINVMYGTVIEHKSEIFLLRHPLGGYPNYLAKLDLFINGMIVELDDGNKVGIYY